MYLENINPVAISDFNIATGVPRVYEFNSEMKLQKVYNVENINKSKDKTS
jgi:bisphosphoglycerate-dependent phosphoglycerate mutase